MTLDIIIAFVFKYKFCQIYNIVINSFVSSFVKNLLIIKNSREKPARLFKKKLSNLVKNQKKNQ